MAHRITNPIRENQTGYIRLVFHHYLYQPPKVTLNNIYKELPTISEITLLSAIKSEALAINLAILGKLYPDIDLKNLISDSTYYGSFFMDFVKAIQSLSAYSFGLKHGTKDYELYRPVADLLKGICKVSLIPVLGPYSFARNLVCEIPARAFLDAMDKIKEEGLDSLSLDSWLKVINNEEFWVDVIREAGLKVMAAKITMDLIIHPFISNIKPIVANVFNELGEHGANIQNFLSNEHKLLIVPITSFANWLKEALTSAVIMPLTRVAVYEKTDEKVLIEHQGRYYCKKFFEVYEYAIKNNIIINYTYDAEVKPKTNFEIFTQPNIVGCECKDNLLILNINNSQNVWGSLNIHYPIEENKIAEIIELVMPSEAKGEL